MRGRPTIYGDDKLINKAQEIFWRKGYTATSLSDLLKNTGAGSGSFYNTFKGGKKEVFRKALQQRREALNHFWQELQNSESPLDDIKEFFIGIADTEKDSHQKGCIIANTVVEMSYVHEDLQKDAITILEDVEQMFTVVIEQAQKEGKITNTTDAAILGKYLITFWCGLNTLRRLYPDKKLLSEQIKFQLSIIS